MPLINHDNSTISLWRPALKTPKSYLTQSVIKIIKIIYCCCWFPTKPELLHKEGLLKRSIGYVRGWRMKYGDEIKWSWNEHDYIMAMLVVINFLSFDQLKKGSDGKSCQQRSLNIHELWWSERDDVRSWGCPQRRKGMARKFKLGRKKIARNIFCESIFLKVRLSLSQISHSLPLSRGFQDGSVSWTLEMV